MINFIIIFSAICLAGLILGLCRAGNIFALPPGYEPKLKKEKDTNKYTSGWPEEDQRRHYAIAMDCSIILAKRQQRDLVLEAERSSGRWGPFFRVLYWLGLL